MEEYSFEQRSKHPRLITAFRAWPAPSNSTVPIHSASFYHSFTVLSLPLSLSPIQTSLLLGVVLRMQN